MPLITALLHTENDARRLGRTLQTLLPCDEIIVVDHDSHDTTRRIARQYGARVVAAEISAPSGHYLQLARHHWIFCLEPRESLTESLEATLLEWKSLHAVEEGVVAFSVLLREETPAGWFNNPVPQTRLVSHGCDQWCGRLPASHPSAPLLEGELLRFTLP
jgi:cellulose synthase/poly-beta-1,6-N-acetylglucosamine synthase-like glycosyltransferase